MDFKEQFFDKDLMIVVLGSITQSSSKNATEYYGKIINQVGDYIYLDNYQRKEMYILNTKYITAIKVLHI